MSFYSRRPTLLFCLSPCRTGRDRVLQEIQAIECPGAAGAHKQRQTGDRGGGTLYDRRLRGVCDPSRPPRTAPAKILAAAAGSSIGNAVSILGNYCGHDV